MDRLPRDIQIQILSLCDTDSRRRCGITPGKLRVPLPIQRKFHDILVKQRQYVARWQTAYEYNRAGHHNLFLMQWCDLTHHEMEKTKPW